MPTKRELRELKEQEQTQQLSVDEIQKEVEKAEAEDEYEGLDVPNFTSRAESPRKAVEKFVESDDDDDLDVEEVAMDKPLKIMIGAVISVVLVVIAIVTVNLINTDPSASQNTTDTVATVTPTVTSETEQEATATPETDSGSLDYYYEQSAISAITNKLDDLYDVDGYTKPSSEQISISGNQNKLTASFTLTVGDSYSKNYTMPAEFQLEWNEDDDKYDVTAYTIDDSEAVKSGFKAHTSKKQAEKTAKSATTEGSEVSNFEVTVRNSVTVTITGKGSGTVTAYAISEDGATTELASVSGGTTTKTVDLEAGQYKLVLYATEDAGYSWNYTLG